MIGIIGALEKEVNQLISYIENKVTETVCGIQFHQGTIYGKQVVISKCGIGKVFASMATTIMIEKYKATEIINTGVGGSLDKQLKIGDICVAKDVCQHDMDTSAVGDEIGLVSGINKIYFETDSKMNDIFIDVMLSEGITYYVKRVATGDVFVASDSKKQYIVNNFNASVCEMEGGAIAQVCTLSNVPFSILRTVSDNADSNANINYNEFFEKSSYVNCFLLKEYIKRR